MFVMLSVIETGSCCVLANHTYALHWIGLGKLLCEYTTNHIGIQTEQT